MFQAEDIQAIRAQFPGLQKREAGHDVAHFDGPAGSQVPICVGEAMCNYLFHMNGNSGGFFTTSRETDAFFAESLEVFATFFGATDGRSIVFGPSMTALTYMISHALEKTWSEGDEIILSQSEHDANFSPWMQAAERAGVVVHKIPLHASDCSLDMDAYRTMLSPKTRLVAVGYASNITGTVHPITTMTKLAHQHQALMYVDAVQYAPHRLVDVQESGCDFLVASAYKFFGPHISVLYGKADLLQDLTCEKLRPVYNHSPDRWIQGTPSFESVAGAVQAVHYIAGMADDVKAEQPLRERLESAFEKIVAYENQLTELLIHGLQQIEGVRIWGMSAPGTLQFRVPTVSFTHSHVSAPQIAEHLSKLGIYVWSGNNFALPLTQALGLEPDGVVRIGIMHYTAKTEIERLLKELRKLLVVS